MSRKKGDQGVRRRYEYIKANQHKYNVRMMCGLLGVARSGYYEWATVARQHNEQVDHWIHWTWNNVHVLPLSRNSASATLEFTYEKVLLSGENVKGYGSWTYVFRLTADGWNVFHSNGHHPVR